MNAANNMRVDGSRNVHMSWAVLVEWADPVFLQIPKDPDARVPASTTLTHCMIAYNILMQTCSESFCSRQNCLTIISFSLRTWSFSSGSAVEIGFVTTWIGWIKVAVPLQAAMVPWPDPTSEDAPDYATTVGRFKQYLTCSALGDRGKRYERYFPRFSDD